MSPNPSFALFPERRLCGPVTTRRMLQSLAVYLVILISGYLLAQMSGQPNLQALGLGGMIPGGGFLAHADIVSPRGIAHIGLAMAGMVAFAISLFLWFTTGNVLAPPLTWLAFALAAASMEHGAPDPRLAPWLLAVILGNLSLIIFGARLCEAIFLHQRREANARLAATGHTVLGTFEDTEHRQEISLDDLRRMDFLLDRALQPLNRFDGFEWLDQFQTAAIRYQLNFMGYALSMAQFAHMPAFQGYLSEAQRNLIMKQADYRVWRYWGLENLWGNLRADPDPVAHENIMFTGFVALQMSMYHSASGRTDFNIPYSFVMRHPRGQEYPYDLPRLTEALARESKKSDFHLIACEPNWIYPLCNTIGAASVKAEDGVRWGAQETVFRHFLEHEFLDLRGQVIPCRSRYTGLALPGIGGIMPQALPCVFLNAILPDIALRQWLVLRDRILTKEGRLRRQEFWRIDTGNYNFSRAAAYAATALAATEMGDGKIRDMCFAALDDECPVRTSEGHFYRPQASVWAHAVEVFARGNIRNGFRDLIRGAAPEAGPYLENVSYQHLRVAAARHDNGRLRLVLYPRMMTGTHIIGFAGLQPGVDYRLSDGRTIRADDQGRAEVNLILEGRTEVCLMRGA